MLSAVIPSRHSYPALPLAGQPVHQRSVRSGPLVLRTTPLKHQRLQQIGDQPVSRRSEPSSRTTLMGEQPNPWELLHPQDVMSRHRCRFFFRYRKGRTISSPSIQILNARDGVLVSWFFRKLRTFDDRVSTGL